MTVGRVRNDPWIMNPLPSSGSSLRGIPIAAAALTDVVCVCAAATVAYLLSAFAYGLVGWEYAPAAKVFHERLWSLPFLGFGIVGWFLFAGHYHSRTPFWNEAREVFVGSGFALLAEGFLLFAGKVDGSRVATFVTWLGAPFVIMAGRHLLRLVGRRFGRGEANVLVVGKPPQAAAARRAVLADSHLGYRVVGVSQAFDAGGILAQATSLCADTVVVALSGDDASENCLPIKLRAMGFRVILVPPPLGFAVSGLKMQYVIGQDSILLVDKVDVMPRLSRLSKRAFDVALSSVALVLAAVPMAIVAALVIMDGGPAIFGHERVGQGGRKFRCLKFRSMAVDAEARLSELLNRDPLAREEWTVARKLKNDPRISSVGRFIRKVALDELPQLANVLKGDMSLVGPRPVTEDEMENYGAASSLYLSVRPGVTGLWQVSGRNDLNYEERVGLDAWYVRNWSPWHDIAILLKTVPALLTRRGAY